MPDDGQLYIATNPSQLKQLAERLSRKAMLGVDTESNSLHAYKERLCLLQFSTDKEDAVVDPLTVEDLSPLSAIFANPEIEKIFHAAEYDLIVLNRDYGFPIVNIFDTMIAARILGHKRVGLGNLLEEEFGIKLEKKFQRADWGERPLRRELLEYARMDTHHLIELRDHLKQELEDRGRWELAKEDFERLPHLVAETEPQVQDVWRIKGARDLNPRQAAILQELAIYREAKAASADVPLFKVIGDSTLTAIAVARPRRPADFKGILGMTPRQIQRHAKGLLDAVKRGEHAPPLRRPKRPRYDEAFVERLDNLRAWRKNAAAEMDVESDVVLPRDLMEITARANPRKMGELEPIMAQVPWRLRTYGAQIMETLKGKKVDK
ncbi:MAG TPA: HRDC domain-containing protein [Anaerolineales bacterium]|nr:HRDC domain-containing protein [Anaerolineales bacterium]